MSATTLTLRDDEDKIVSTVSGIFCAEDTSLLQRFVEAMVRVRNATLLQRGLPAITNFKITATGITASCEPYTDTELFELLHVLRHVILSQEAMSFEKVAALLGKRFSCSEFRYYLKDIRQLYEKGELSFYMRFSVDDQPIFDESLLRLWLNGTQYHTDEEKAVAWVKIERFFKPENARAVIMNQLHGKVNALFILEHIAKLIISKQTPT